MKFISQTAVEFYRVMSGLQLPVVDSFVVTVQLNRAFMASVTTPAAVTSNHKTLICDHWPDTPL